MNRSRWLLLSLTLNGLLLFAVAWRWRPALVPSTLAGVVEPAIVPGFRVEEPAPAGSTDAMVETSAAIGTFHWSQFDRNDWPAYRDGLRGIGCPERTVREILEPLVRRTYYEQMRAAAAPYVSHFWEVLSAGDTNGFEPLKTVLKSLSAEQRESLKNLLGDDSSPDAAPTTGHKDHRLAFLPSALVEQVVKSEVHHEERLQEFARSFKGPEKERTEGIRRLKQEFDQELAGLLSPEELAQFRNRNSRFASLRELEGIELNETELAEIIRVKEREKKGSAAEAKEMEKLLGPERLAEFERAQQPGYQDLLRLSERLNAPPSVAGELWAEQQRAEQQAQVLKKETQLNDVDRAAKLASERDRLRARAGQVLGAGGQAAWDRQQAGWLKQAFQVPEENPLVPPPGNP